VKAAAPSSGAHAPSSTRSRAMYTQVVNLHQHPTTSSRPPPVSTAPSSKAVPRNPVCRLHAVPTSAISLTPNFHLAATDPAPHSAGPIGYTPPSVRAAQKHPSWPLWDAAIRKELEGLTSRGTWTPVPTSSVPADTRVMDSKFVLKDKKTTGPKARLVVRGDQQYPYPPSRDTYAHTPSATEVRTFFASTGN